MCFGGSPKIEMPPPPAVAPIEEVKPSPAAVATEAIAPKPPASPQATEVSPQVTAEARRRRIAAARYGMMSTIKTSPQGIPTPGVTLEGNEQGKKKALGA